jgi:hypothetical protein
MLGGNPDVENHKNCTTAHSRWTSGAGGRSKFGDHQEVG